MYLTFAVQFNYTLDLNLLLQTFYKTVTEQAHLIEKCNAKIDVLESKIESLNEQNIVLQIEITELKNKKNSNNSHIPPSQDQNRPKTNQSLRVSSGKKVGGQPGHEGTTLQCSVKVDEIIKHVPDNCSNCGNDLSGHPEVLISSRQLLDIPPIVMKCIEHRLYRKQCSCGQTMQGSFPQHVASPVQYGPNVETLVSYLNARQYMPYNRMQEFLKDVMGLPLSTGGIYNILQRMAKKATPVYDQIKAKIEQATYVGADETGVNINGKNHWAWTWQNAQLTYIVCAAGRGFQTIEEVFSNGLPNAVLVHDRWPCHFKMIAKAHQICCAHLLRDLNYINELYKDNCTWAKDFKAILLEALELKKELTVPDYYYQNKKREALFEKLNESLQFPIEDQFKKSKTLQKKLLAKQDCILYFLSKANVPSDNNGSERAIRNIKVKQKISGQFKSLENANVFAILRSVIDTTIKSGNNVLNALHLIATFGTE